MDPLRHRHCAHRVSPRFRRNYFSASSRAGGQEPRDRGYPARPPPPPPRGTRLQSQGIKYLPSCSTFLQITRRRLAGRLHRASSWIGLSAPGGEGACMLRTGWGGTWGASILWGAREPGAHLGHSQARGPARAGGRVPLRLPAAAAASQGCTPTPQPGQPPLPLLLHRRPPDLTGLFWGACQVAGTSPPPYHGR